MNLTGKRERKRIKGSSSVCNHYYSREVTKFVFRRNSNGWDCLNSTPMQTRVFPVHFTAETSTREHLLQIATVIIGEGLAAHPQGSPAVIEVQFSYRTTLDPEALVWQQLLLLLRL